MSEYWIKDGDIVYCDGDAGQDVPNHAMVVVTHCIQQVIDILENFDDSWAGALRESFERHLVDSVVDCISLRSELNDEVDNWVAGGFITEEEVHDVFDAACDRYGIDYEIMSTAMGHNDDPRVLGVQKFGWIRVEGSNFDVWELDRVSCELMADFAFEYPHDEWWIEVQSEGNLFIGPVPTHSLDSPVEIRKIARVNAA